MGTFRQNRRSKYPKNKIKININVTSPTDQRVGRTRNHLAFTNDRVQSEVFRNEQRRKPRNGPDIGRRWDSNDNQLHPLRISSMPRTSHRLLLPESNQLELLGSNWKRPEYQAGIWQKSPPRAVTDCAFFQEIQETGSDLLLPISKGTTDVISQVVAQLMRMIKSDQNQNDIKTPNRQSDITRVIETPEITVTNSSFKSFVSATFEPEMQKEQNGDGNDLRNEPDGGFVNPEVPMSPTRYRSLDTLSSDITGSELPGELHGETGPESLPNITYNSVSIDFFSM